MPGAQAHLAAVCNLLASPAISDLFPHLSAEGEARSACLLGAVSPDVRAVSRQAREETHFFAIPPQEEAPAQAIMLARWPELHRAPTRDLLRAAFVAGYITHLVMDQTWVEMIVMPSLFIEGRSWGVFHPRWRTYSLLMTYLEDQASRYLSGGLAEQLVRAEPRGWLPFVRDRHLIQWRDHVAGIISSGGIRPLARMFALSNGMPVETLETIIRSEERRGAEVYRHVSRERLTAFEAETARRSQQAVTAYLLGRQGG
jgi:hypothetical protein